MHEWFALGHLQPEYLEDDGAVEKREAQLSQPNTGTARPPNGAEIVDDHLQNSMHII